MNQLNWKLSPENRSHHPKADCLLTSGTILASPYSTLLLLWVTLHTGNEAGRKADAWIKTGLKVQSPGKIRKMSVVLSHSACHNRIPWGRRIKSNRIYYSFGVWEAQDQSEGRLSGEGLLPGSQTASFSL